MTHLSAHFAAQAGIPPSRVIGSGTMLDTARFRALLGRHFDVDPHHVHAYVLGEHGDSEVLAWSQCSIAGLPLIEFAPVHGTPLTPADQARIDEQVRRAAYHIIAGKGATYYGIGSAVARLVDVILHDQRAIVTVCCRDDHPGPFHGVTYSVPRLLGRNGVLASIPQSLTESEDEALGASVNILREAIHSLGIA
jgi:L-lactate dehydrogenase